MRKSKPKIDYLAQLEKDMVFVEKGTFLMGEDKVETVIEKDFYICKYVVTQGLWKAVMGEDNNPSEFRGDNRPVENVSWYDIDNDFLPQLNKITKRNYKLSLEKEWEFAARGGKNGNHELEYSGTDNIKEVGWCGSNGNSRTHPVGLKLPNSLGLYDMSGNIWEWCQDKDDENYRVSRGGSWDNYPINCSSSNRFLTNTLGRYDDIGFRLVRH